MLKNIVSGNEIGLAVEFDKSSPVVSVSESKQTLGGRTSGFLGRKNFSSFPELSLRGVDIPIWIHECSLHVFDRRACSFSQLLYQIHLVWRRRRRRRRWGFGGEGSRTSIGKKPVVEDGSDRARAFCCGGESHDELKKEKRCRLSHKWIWESVLCAASLLVPKQLCLWHEWRKQEWLCFVFTKKHFFFFF